MNADIHLEHRAGSSQGKHEGEPSLGLCDRLNRTRDNSQRQLPTDHDYAVPTREYQTDQSSLKTAPTAARSVFGKRQKHNDKNNPTDFAELTRSLHIRPNALIEQARLKRGRRPANREFWAAVFQYIARIIRHVHSLGSDLNDQSLRTSKLDKVVYPLCVTTRIGTCENDPGFCTHLNRAVTEIEKYHYAFVLCGSFVA